MSVDENLRRVRERLSEAATRAGRDPAGITLIAVSKMHTVEAIRAAIDAGVNTFGENKVQEADGKIAELGRETAKWHLIGHLQSNKARKAVQLFDVIESLDSLELAQRLERICIEEDRDRLDVFIQVDLGDEDTKSGIPQNDLPPLIDFLDGCERLKLAGLMTLPPFFDDAEDARPFFLRLRKMRDELVPNAALSMGMSNDFEVAIEEGSTHVRVGTAIFGSRVK
ncbi:MAG: YggS family pyridoxal phosphate-dependent enzyme [Blastocatellia bacterium]|nr:YggS family pyridoxal phosphate-dependent enzyme [Blastocatellia bacterium]